MHQYVNNSSYGLCGGAGGGAGFIVATEATVLGGVSVVIGAGGSGGAAVNSGGFLGLTGNNGAKGGDTQFGTNTIDGQVQLPILAIGGSGGVRGVGFIKSQQDPNVTTKGGAGSSFGGEGIVSHTFDYKNGQSGGGQMSDFPQSLSAGGGGGGGISPNGNSTSSVAGYYGAPGGLGGVGALGTGGNGAVGRAVNDSSSTVIGFSGTNATGVGAGGGGGGVAINFPSNSITANSGAGGNGSAGAVYIYY
jgi:hypothetical protein